jgi:uncharacterized protein YbjT (DUF2867 family)
MSNSPILVVGATGKTGRRVSNLLQKHGFDVRAVSRKSKIPFDWDDSSTWSRALEGVHTVYIVHPGLGSKEAAEQVGAFAKAASKEGVSKAVLASTPDDGSEFSQSMRTAEKYLTAAGLALTSLRLRWFFQNFSEDFLLQPVLSGKLRLPAGLGKEAFVDADDIAEVALAALTDDRHNGKLYDLTGPRTLSFSDIAEEITRGPGHKVQYDPHEPGAFLAEQLDNGVPADWAYTLCAMYQDIATGRLNSVSSDIEQVLGKPARDFSEFASHMAKEKTWADRRAR